MRRRRRFLRATLAALVALVLLGGIGAGVWVASSDEDEPISALALEPPETDAEPAQDSSEEQPPRDEETTPPEPSTPSEPADPPSAQPEASAPFEPSAPSERSAESEVRSKPNTTRFQREQRKDPDRRGKRFLVPPAHTFTGTGNALIGTVDVRQPALVRWRSRGSFGLEFGQEAFPIVAPSRSGQLVVPPYRFELVRVLANGRWTITVTPEG
jgi:hypothetical protein